MTRQSRAYRPGAYLQKGSIGDGPLHEGEDVNATKGSRTPAKLAAIPFTQYLLPHGSQQAVSVERPQSVMDRAAEIIDKGFVFEIEILTTNDVSMTITHPEYGDMLFQICANNEKVPAAVDRLVNSFDDETAANWIKMHEQEEAAREEGE